LRNPNTKYEDLKLLSINQVRTVLGIRFETAKILVNDGKIKFIEINGRKKIPLKNLIEYLDRQNVIQNHSNDGIISSEETQNKIDLIIESIQRSTNGHNIHTKKP
jgi:hypothetical protein